jgi:hypothetical protein
MASNGKKKTTMAKLMRESRLRERRLDKQAKKDARKQGLSPPADEAGDPLNAAPIEQAPPEAGAPELDTVVQPVTDA